MALAREDKELQALEIFVQSEDCPRWVKKRFEYQNRERQTRAPQARRETAVEVQDADQTPWEELSASRREMVGKVQEGHGLIWAKRESHWTVQDALEENKRS